MEFTEIFSTLWKDYPGQTMLAGFIALIGIVGKMKLFAKANQPILAAFVPIWDMAVTLKMVGRPITHLAYLLVPFYNIYFCFKLLIEIAQCYGKTSVSEYVFVCLFNVFYILNLALAYNEVYLGPVYGLDIKDVQSRKPALV